jgi:hypothetical protein
MNDAKRLRSINKTNLEKLAISFYSNKLTIFQTMKKLNAILQECADIQHDITIHIKMRKCNTYVLRFFYQFNEFF